MRNFLNKLTDSIMVTTEDGKIIFLNESFLNVIGYEKKELNLCEADMFIKKISNEIYIYNEDVISKQGIYEVDKIQWEGKEALALTVKWKEELASANKLKVLEKLLFQIDKYISIKNLHNEVVYANKSKDDLYSFDKKTINTYIENILSDEEIHNQLKYRDNYVIENKNSCTFEIEKNNDGIMEYYQISKYPILNQDGEVEYIGSLVEDVSLNKNIQYKILNNLNLIDSDKENECIKIKDIDKSIFENLRNIFAKFLGTKYFNIWIYDKTENCIKSKFPIITSNEGFDINDYFNVREGDVEKYINGNYSKVIEVNNVYSKSLGYKKTYFVVSYPLINQQEFKGIVTLAYEEYPEQEVIDNDLIHTICNQIGFMLKYIEMANRITKELKHRSEVESLLEAFLEVSADLVFMMDETGIKFVGERCLDILGWTQEEFLKLYPNELVHPDDLNKTLDIMKKQINTKETFELEHRIKCSDGRGGKWIRWRSKNLIDSKGYIFASGEDITCNKVVEEQEKEIEKVKQLEEVRNEFFANISHEFKTPINMIMTTSQLMSQQLYKYEMDSDNEAEIKKYINIFRQNGYRLLRLVNNLIDITKIDSGFYKIKPVNTNIISVVEDIVLSVAELCEGNKIQLVFDTEVEEEIIACDPDQVERIVLNLLSNAIKYTPESGKIKVNIFLEGEYVVIIVKDTGSGIPKEKLEVIFERFVQCEHTLTRNCEGSGIGLSLVKGLVDMHDGNIKVSSDEGVGSTFEVRFPRQQVQSSDNFKVSNQEIKQSKIEKCSIEFADIYNL